MSLCFSRINQSSLLPNFSYFAHQIILTMKNYFVALFLFLTHVIYSQQTIFDTIVHDGLQRSFILYVPDIYSPALPAPLVINFHGYTSNAWEQMYYGDFRPVADTAGFLVVHPMGTLDDSGNTYWNSNWGGQVDDIGFTEALIDSLAADYNINLQRVYSAGMSNGGFMSYTLACALSNRIAAIASVTGTMNAGQVLSCLPQRPLPVMEIHGTADYVVPYNGNAYMESIQNTLNFWINFNSCNAEPIVTQVPDINQSDGCTAENYLYPEGSEGVDVEHYKIINGGHTWPGSLFPSGGGFTNQDFDASEKIWAFFAKYDLNGQIGTNDLKQKPANLTGIKLYPNPAKDFLNVFWNKASVAKIRLIDRFGSVIKNINATGKECEVVDLENLNPGIYFLQFYDNSNQTISSKKLIVN